MSIFAPNYAFIGEQIWLNCTTDESPYNEAAKFLLNGETFYTIARNNGQCFSTLQRSKFLPISCWCGRNGRHYTVLLKIEEPKSKHLEVSCFIDFFDIESMVGNNSKIIAVKGMY